MCLIYPSNSHSDFHKAFSRRDILLITHFPLTFCLTIWQSYWPLSKCWNSPDLGTLIVAYFLQHCTENIPTSPLSWYVLTFFNYTSSISWSQCTAFQTGCCPSTLELPSSNQPVFHWSEQFIGHHSCVRRIWQVQDGGSRTWGYLLMNMMKMSLILPVACSWMNHFHSLTELFWTQASLLECFFDIIQDSMHSSVFSLCLSVIEAVLINAQNIKPIIVSQMTGSTLLPLAILHFRLQWAVFTQMLP